MKMNLSILGFKKIAMIALVATVSLLSSSFASPANATTGSLLNTLNALDALNISYTQAKTIMGQYITSDSSTAGSFTSFQKPADAKTLYACVGNPLPLWEELGTPKRAENTPEYTIHYGSGTGASLISYATSTNGDGQAQAARLATAGACFEPIYKSQLEQLAKDSGFSVKKISSSHKVVKSPLLPKGGYVVEVKVDLTTTNGGALTSHFLFVKVGKGDTLANYRFTFTSDTWDSKTDQQYANAVSKLFSVIKTLNK